MENFTETFDRPTSSCLHKIFLLQLIWIIFKITEICHLKLFQGLDWKKEKPNHLTTQRGCWKKDSIDFIQINKHLERWQNVYCALFHECWIKNTWDIHMTFRKYQIRMSFDIAEKWSFSLRISSVNVTKSTVLENPARRIWSHLQKKFLMKNFIFCAVRNYSENKILKKNIRCVKSVQIRSYFWSVFSCIRIECGDLRSKSPYSIRIQENTDQK